MLHALKFPKNTEVLKQLWPFLQAAQPIRAIWKARALLGEWPSSCTDMVVTLAELQRSCVEVKEEASDARQWQRHDVEVFRKTSTFVLGSLLRRICKKTWGFKNSLTSSCFFCVLVVILSRLMKRKITFIATTTEQSEAWGLNTLYMNMYILIILNTTK